MARGRVDPRRIGARRGRLGCLGCLGKLVASLLGALVFGSLLILAIDAVFMPWSFYMGGRFHPIPMWRGWGKVRSAAGRDYALYVWFEPYHSSGRGGVAMNAVSAEVVGWGTLCSPHGETYDVRVTGYMPRNMGASTDGKRVDLHVYRRPWYYGFVGKWDERPQVEFWGAWKNPDLVLEDRGSLDRAFNPDGTLRSSNSGVWIPGEHGVPLTLREGTKAEFAAACAEVQGH
ncbi:MAG TPA: hypothetical protein VL523_04980 [Terriglobia bacterium]|nr:hypothetical protein [Terriglobia bacterium]